MLPSNVVLQKRPLWSVAGVLALGAFGISILAQLLVLLLNQQTGVTTTADETPLTLARGALVVQFALAALIALTLRKPSTLRARALPFERVSYGTLLVGLGLTLGLAPVANALGAWVSETLHVPMDASRWVTVIVQHATRGDLLLLGLALTIAPACVEELLFRGLIMGALSGAHRVAQLALPALVFGVFHADWAQGAATFVLGVGFGFMRLTTRSLLVPMICHAAYNLMVLISMRSMSGTTPASHQEWVVLCAGLLVALACAAALERGHRQRMSPGIE